MTINQAIDEIFDKYQGIDMGEFPSVNTLRQNLIELKLTYGGNTLVENVDTVKGIIRTGASSPEDLV